MKARDKLNLSQDMKLYEALTAIKYKCRHCGHTQYISNKVDKCLCDWCGYYIFKTSLDEFKYRIKELKK